MLGWRILSKVEGRKSKGGGKLNINLSGMEDVAALGSRAALAMTKRVERAVPSALLNSV